jgi:hypothetical protein
MDSEIIQFSGHVLEKDYQLPVQLNFFYQFFLAIYARALLNSGRPDEGIPLFGKVRLKKIPETIKNYIRIRYKLIETEFSLYSGELSRARENLKEIKAIAQMLRFTYFYNQATALETKAGL